MSNHSTIAPAFLDIAELVGALVDLHRAYRKADQLKTTDGKTVPVEYVFKDAVGRDAGLQKTEKGFQVVTDCHGLSAAEAKKQAESVSEIVRRYSHRKIVKELQAQGYVIAEEEKRADNTIRLVARKWG